MSLSNFHCYPRIQEILNFYCDKKSIYNDVFNIINQFVGNCHFCLHIGYFKHFTFGNSFANNLIFEPFKYSTILSYKRRHSHNKSSKNFGTFKDYEDFSVFKNMLFDKIIMLHFIEYQVELLDLFTHIYPLLSDKCEILIFLPSIPSIFDKKNNKLFSCTSKIPFLDMHLEKIIKNFDMIKVENFTIFKTMKNSIIKIPVFKVIKIAKKNFFNDLLLEDQII